MNEIGGYFGLEELIHHEYYPNLAAVNTARNALLYLVKARGIRRLYLPYFLCDSVVNLCRREGIACEQYHITPDFLPVFDGVPERGAYLYVVNYYGQLDENTVRKLQAEHHNLILDNVQAFFEPPVQGVDTIYSCRKFFGVPDGAYLATDATLEEEPPQDVSMERMRHILGRYEGASANAYYADFKANDRSFAELPLRAMSKLTHNILGAIDYEAAKARREQNFAILHERLGRRNRLKLTIPAGPYAYPVYCENGMEVKRRLADQKIYVPTLWPNVLELDGTMEKDYAENILPLPCDQRYGAAEMERICGEIE